MVKRRAMVKRAAMIGDVIETEAVSSRFWVAQRFQHCDNWLRGVSALAAEVNDQPAFTDGRAE
jgi:hypothetical protein